MTVPTLSDKYFELRQDHGTRAADSTWHLDIDVELADGTWWDVWAYTRCTPASAPPYPYYVGRSGTPADINCASAFSMLIVSHRVLDILTKLVADEVQYIPVDVKNNAASWTLINPLKLVDCLDLQRSVIFPWYPLDFERHELAGKPRGVIKLMVEPSKAKGHHMFRIRDWRMPIIVSHEVAEALLEIDPIGCRLDPVS